MTTLPDTMQEYSRSAAQSFIQTAVFVDDKIYKITETRQGGGNLLSAPKTRKKVVKSLGEESDLPVASVTERTAGEDSSPDTYDIVTSFAKKQIVCSLYQPKSTAKVSFTSDVFLLCKAADIVIVDWDLFGDKGQRALELSSGLIVQAVKDEPEQLRLILVYTQENNLFGVADELYQKVQASIGDVFTPVAGGDGLVFHTTNSRVVVLGKPGRDRADVNPYYIVEEKNLADIAVREFARMASGLLQTATLLGLAEIRKNSRKILSKFNSELDPAFLTHLGLCLPEEDATSHIIPLLVSEIEAVLEDALPSPLMPEAVLKDWCQNVWVPGKHFKLKHPEDRHFAENVCIHGFKQAAQECNRVPNPDKKIREAAKMLLPSEESDINHRLSHLMASRTFYGDSQKALRLGTIVHDRDAERYFLCLQPVCDSVRLDEERIFLFVEMQVSISGQESVSHVVIGLGNQPIGLFYKPKSFMSFTASFSPDRNRRQVVARKEVNEESYFVDTKGNKYYWIDQLRTAHAQRAAERFAGDLSRVGLTESEWLRRLEK